MRVPHGPTEWEDFYYLPRGVVDAILTCPTPARICEVIAQVRDEALRERGLPVPGEGQVVTCRRCGATRQKLPGASRYTYRHPNGVSVQCHEFGHDWPRVPAFDTDNLTV